MRYTPSLPARVLGAIEAAPKLRRDEQPAFPKDGDPNFVVVESLTDLREALISFHINTNTWGASTAQDIEAAIAHEGEHAKAYGLAGLPPDELRFGLALTGIQRTGLLGKRYYRELVTYPARPDRLTIEQHLLVVAYPRVLSKGDRAELDKFNTSAASMARLAIDSGLPDLVPLSQRGPDVSPQI